MLKIWINALRVIPQVTQEEWNRYDFISRWLIASRAAVFIMTAIAAGIGGLLAYRTGFFSWYIFLLSFFGLVLAHATNNLLNDYVDYNKGVDKDNYYRAQYGPHPLENGFVTRNKFIAYIVVTGILALSAGLLITYQVGLSTLWVLLPGLFFLLFYTWPLKYFGLGEISVVLVWGPLMIGGTYFVVSGGQWSNWVALVSLVYAFGPTTVLLGKHTDKLAEDKAKGIRTLPVIIGEKISRYSVIGLWILQYALVIFLVVTAQLGPAVLLILLSIPKFIKESKVMLKKRPDKAPEGELGKGWPLYLVHRAFVFNKSFGMLFLLGLIIDVILLKII
ncbi:MAG: ubiquinone biosynthesis protein UbiA [Bacteroidetes bacterium GWA2_31_9b]|nr:MAG: ubiquinone biosynthesis protein UbiA [Bacteroidetes bacterium GWA2_31_9b]